MSQSFKLLYFLDLKIMKGIFCRYPVFIFSLANLNLSRKKTYLDTQGLYFSAIQNQLTVLNTLPAKCSLIILAAALLLTCECSLQCNFSNQVAMQCPSPPLSFLFSKTKLQSHPQSGQNLPVIFNFAQTIWYMLLNKLSVSYHLQLITKAGETVHFTAVRNNPYTRWPSKF